MIKLMLSFFAALLVGQSFYVFGPVVTIFLCFLTLMAYAFIFHFKKMFVFFIVARPVFDMAGGYGINIGNTIINTAAIMSFLFVVGGFFYIFLNKKRVFVCNEVTAYFCFLVFSIIGILFNMNIVGLDGVFAWLRLAIVIVVMLVIFHDYKDRESLIRLIKYILLSACIPIAYAIVQIFTGIGITYGQGFERINGGFSHGNVFATYLVLFIVLIFSIMAFRNTIILNINKLYLWLLFIAMFSCLFLTFARGAWISLGISLVIIASLYSRKKLVIGVMLISSLILLVYSLTGKLILIDEIMRRFADLSLPGGTRFLNPMENSFVWRVIYWKELILKLKDSPIFGFGLGSVVKLGSAHIEAHNNYIQVFFESGIGGLFYYGMIIMFLFRALRGTGSSFLNVRAYSIGALGIIIAYLINSISGHLVRNAVFQIYFVALLMIMIALSNEAKTIDNKKISVYR